MLSHVARWILSQNTQSLFPPIPLYLSIPLSLSLSSSHTSLSFSCIVEVFLSFFLPLLSSQSRFWFKSLMVFRPLMKKAFDRFVNRVIVAPKLTSKKVLNPRELVRSKKCFKREFLRKKTFQLRSNKIYFRFVSWERHMILNCS